MKNIRNYNRFFLFHIILLPLQPETKQPHVASFIPYCFILFRTYLLGVHEINFEFPLLKEGVRVRSKFKIRVLTQII